MIKAISIVILIIILSLNCIIKPKVYGSIESTDKQYRIDFAQVDPGAIGSLTTHIYLVDNKNKFKKRMLFIDSQCGVKGDFKSDTLLIYTLCDSSSCTQYFSRYSNLIIKVINLTYYSDFFDKLGPKLPDEK